MPQAIVAGLALVDPIGRAILATTLVCLFSAIAANLYLRRVYRSLLRDLEQGTQMFKHAVLNRIVGDALDATRQSGAASTQAIIEERLQSELRGPMLAERFVRAATGLVIILGLLGTFYGLTLSIGRIVHLVAGDVNAHADVGGAVTSGLTHALSGMAVAFSNSLVGVTSAVILTLLNVFSNPNEARVRLMLQLETRLDRLVPSAPAATGDRGFVEAVAQLERVVTRFEAGLTRFSESSREFHEFNAHLKDNIQRMSLSFGDFSDALKGQVVALKTQHGR